MAKKTAPPIVESDEIPVIDSKDIPTPEPITSEPKTEEPSASIEDVLTLQRRLDSMKQSAINGLLKRIEEAKSQLRELGYTEDVPFAAASPTPTKRKYAFFLRIFKERFRRPIQRRLPEPLLSGDSCR